LVNCPIVLELGHPWQKKTGLPVVFSYSQ